MEEITHKKGKIYYSMGEVAEMFDVNPSLIRFWEKKFDVIKPHKNKKGNRMFTPEDVDNIKLIYHLVKERGMTLIGAQKHLKGNRGDAIRDMEIADRLLAIKAMLLEIRQELKEEGEVFPDENLTAGDAADDMAETFMEERAAETETHGKPQDKDEVVVLASPITTEIVTDGSQLPEEERADNGAESNEQEMFDAARREILGVKEMLGEWYDMSSTQTTEGMTADEESAQPTRDITSDEDTIHTSENDFTGPPEPFSSYEKEEPEEDYSDPWEEVGEPVPDEGRPLPGDVFGTDVCTTFSPDDIETAEAKAEEEAEEEGPKRPQIYEQTLF